ICSDVVALADNAPAFHAATCKINCPTLRPMIAAARRIDFGGSSKFRQVADECVVQHSSLEKIFEQCAITLVVHRRDNVAHSFDGGEWFGAVNIPGDFVE